MGTKFEEVYACFLSNITDYSLVRLYEESPDEYKNQLKEILFAALPNSTFKNTQLDSIQEDTEQFSNTLTSSEKSILGKLMAIEYLTPFVLDETLTRQKLNPRDYKTYNEGRHAESFQKIKDSLHIEVNRSMSRISYTVENISSLFGGGT